MNLYPEPVEVGNEPRKLVLYGRPGLHLFTTLSPAKIRGMWAGGGRLFVIHGPNQTEVLQNGAFITSPKTVATGGSVDPDPAQIFSNGHQLMIVSGGYVYCDNGAGPDPVNFLLLGNGNTVNFNSTLVRTQGPGFDGSWTGKPIKVDDVDYLVAGVANDHTLLLNTPPPDATEIQWSIAEGDPVTGVTGAFLDGYFIVNRGRTTSGLFQPRGPLRNKSGVQEYPGRQINISALNDGTQWNPLMFAVKEGGADYIRSILADHEELYLFGDETSEIWTNTGDPNFPFQRISGAFIHEGSVATFAPCSVMLSVCWLAGGANGQVIAYRAQGLQPKRISTHAQESEWNAAGFRVYDAVSYGYNENGHTFWVVNFWQQQRTWVYDLNTDMWHERAGWDATSVQYLRYRGWFHVFIPEWGENGKHIVGDPQTGRLYESNANFYDDDGTNIACVRAFPHLLNENRWNYHHRIELYCETGTVPASVAAPNLSMDWSDDRGHTFVNGRQVTLGPNADYKRRVVFRRLGKARDRVYRIGIQSQSKVAITDAFLEMSQGTV